jgi:hypothetical protein
MGQMTQMGENRYSDTRTALAASIDIGEMGISDEGTSDSTCDRRGMLAWSKASNCPKL